jgi:tripartite-type tricarboxylate transporter receptor subunit TctC
MNRKMPQWLIALASICVASGAAAQGFPAKPVRVVVGFAPGGAADVLARAVTPRAGELLGQPVVVDNRAGAAGVIAIEHVAKSMPDGYSLLLGSVNVYLIPFIAKNVPYDSARDFTPVVLLANGYTALAVHPSLPVHSVKEFVEYAKKQGKVFYGTVGIGSLHHLGGVMLAQAAGIDLEHVPYKGGSPTINDVMAGVLPAAILAASTVFPHGRSGKLRVLGVIDASRSRAAPDVPTIGESIPGYAAPGQWFGLLGPAGVPPPAVARINTEFRKALAEPEVQKRIEALGFEVAGNSPDEFAAKVKADSEAIRKAVAAAGIKPE